MSGYRPDPQSPQGDVADPTTTPKPDAKPPEQTPPPPGDRAIAEADIIQIDGDKLYAISPYGHLSIVDIKGPAHLALLGQTQLLGVPFEMYRRGEKLQVLSNYVDGGAAVISVDVSDPAHPSPQKPAAVNGTIMDSRLMGEVLYVVSVTGPDRTAVATFDEKLALLDGLEVVSRGEGYTRTLVMTDRHLYIGGTYELGEDYDEGIVDVVDVSDPKGKLVRGVELRTAGALLNRWQLDERGGVLRVISQKGLPLTANGVDAPIIQTFTVAANATFTALGRARMRLPRQEGLRAVRFDDTRAYAVTFQQTDPVFVIDLADAAQPLQRGELQLPGFLVHLQPLGDRLLGLGVDASDEHGSLNVTLVDVSDADAPRLIERQAFGTPLAIGMAALPEDQDRLQKAFRILSNGLVVVPFSADTTKCDNAAGGVQALSFSRDTLTKRALLPLPGRPRRAFEHQTELLGVSESHVRAFDLATLEATSFAAEVAIGECVEPKTDHQEPKTEAGQKPQSTGPDLGADTGTRGDYGVSWQHSQSKAQTSAPAQTKSGCAQAGAPAEAWLIVLIAILCYARRRWTRSSARTR